MYGTDDLNTTINPNNVTTGGPVEGGCCYTNFSDNPTLPTDASESLVGVGSTWENVGELSDQGWTQSTSTSVNKFKGYHGSVLLTEVADEENTFKAEFLEITRATTDKLRYGESRVTVDQDGFVSAIDPTTVPGHIVPLVFDELLSNGIKQRTVFPRAKIDSIDDQAHQRGSLMVYGMTFTALVDSNGRPYYVRRYRPRAAVDTTLNSLTVGTLPLTPSFAPSRYSYAAETTESSVAVTAVPNDSDATVAIKNGSTTVTNGGSASLSAGENVIKVTVTNGTATQEYTITVIKS